MLIGSTVSKTEQVIERNLHVFLPRVFGTLKMTPLNFHLLGLYGVIGIIIFLIQCHNMIDEMTRWMGVRTDRHGVIACYELSKLNMSSVSCQ